MKLQYANTQYSTGVKLLTALATKPGDEACKYS